jgi:SAM-dependent methyltransferase
VVLQSDRGLSPASIAAAYEARTEVGLWPRPFYDKVAGLGGDLAGRRVLEIGCGRGGLLSVLAEHKPDHRHAVDLVPLHAREAALRGGLGVRIVLGDLEVGLPYAAGVFDVIFAMEVLEHLRAPLACLAEIRRVLKPDGRFVLSIPNATGYAPFHRLGPLLPGRWLKRKLLPYEHPVNTRQPVDTMYRYSEILALLHRGGFVVERQRGYRYFRYALGFPIIRLVYGPIGPRADLILDRLRAYRFAYHLIVRCRPMAPPTSR